MFALVLLTAVACVVWPLATYTTTLAVLGLPHVLVELRYVQRRFGARLARGTAASMAGLLLMVVGLRVARNLDGADSTGAIELAAVAFLMLTVFPALGWRWRGASLLLAAAGLTAAALSPAHALLLLAVAHNFTPIGFLAEALSGRRRRNALAVAFALFIAVPLLIATGVPFTVLNLFGWTAPDFSLLPAGPLSSHLGVYLPDSWRGEAWAGHAFSGAVFAQCMHYAAVLHVLPRLQSGVRTPSFYGLVALATAGLFAVFFLDFSDGRRWYGVAAAVHAWVELPILMLAFGTVRSGS